MNSKKLEEVRKRRAEDSPSKFNPYQKTILVAGALALFLILGLNPQRAPFLAAGVAVGTLLIFLILGNLKAKKGEKNKVASQETLPEGQEALEPEPISSRADEEIIAVSPEVISQHTNSDALQDSICLEPEEVITTPGIPFLEKKDLSPAEGFSGVENMAQIQKRLATLEEKVTNLENLLLSLEEKLADRRETQVNSDPRIDLQAMLTNPDGKEEEIVR